MSPKKNQSKVTISENFLKKPAASPSSSLQEILAYPDIIASHHHPLLGRLAPDFAITDLEGKVWTLCELRDGQPTVVIFYYGYRCHSCVRQLFAINTDLPLFHELGARVIAISADPPELTQRGIQQNGPFAFSVLSDPDNKVAQAYQVFKRTQEGNLAESRRHGTFIIDRNGTIQWVNVGDAPFRRNSALLHELAVCQTLARRASEGDSGSNSNSGWVPKISMSEKNNANPVRNESPPATCRIVP